MQKIIVNPLLLIWLCFLIWGKAGYIHAQEATTFAISPNANANPALFTGRLIFTVPLYTIEDPDFPLDIALRYNSEGFKPFKPSGCYGQDWSLVAGGCITRLVQGLADDHQIRHDGPTPATSILYTEWGFTRAIQEGSISDKNAVFNIDESVCDTCGVVAFPDSLAHGFSCKNNKIDYLPDIFTFNFCGYKGRFIINNKGEASIISGDLVKVDISQMQEVCWKTVSDNYYSQYYKSQISIYTTDGYCYTFGGNGHSSAIEYSFFCKKNKKYNQRLPAITAWHLTKITAPNGRTLVFNYSYGGNVENSLQSFVTDYDWSEPSNDSIHIVYSLHKECLLQSISTSDDIPLKITFSSHTGSLPMYEHDDYLYSKPHAQLDSIVVSYNENVLKTIQLQYLYLAHSMEWGHKPNYYWRYLHQIAISGKGKYTMTYSKSSPYIENFPNIEFLSYYPDLNVTSDTEYKNMVDRWGFYRRNSLHGMLSEVSLPTGGKLKFTYGNHQYGEEKRYQVVGNQNVELYTHLNDNQSIGGARIEKIETFSDDSTIIETKSFSYNKKNSYSSSGVYYNIYQVYFPSDTILRLPITNPYNYGMIDSHIGYSYVEQETSIGTKKYKTAFTYDTGINNYSSVANNSINRKNDISGYSDSAEICSGSLTYPEKLRPQGKLLQIDQYNGNSLAKTTLFEYNGIDNIQRPSNNQLSLGCTDTIVVFSKYSGHVARKLFVYPDVLEGTTIYEYEGQSEPLIKNKTYVYDSKFRIKKETTEDSRDIQHFTRYTYPDELNVPYDYFEPSALSLLIKTNRINTPVEVVSGFVRNNTTYVTSGKANLYAAGEYFYLRPNAHHAPPHIIIDSTWYSIRDSLIFQDSLAVIPMVMKGYYPFLYKSLSLSLTKPVSDYQPMSTENGTITFDSRYKLDAEYTYGYEGQLYSIKPFGGIATQYTWDGIYPISKTIGNQTWRYTYLPYVGVSSMTDPRGITTYYTYDTAGRLIEEYQLVNGVKQILNVYQYHIKTE